MPTPLETALIAPTLAHRGSGTVWQNVVKSPNVMLCYGGAARGRSRNGSVEVRDSELDVPASQSERSQGGSRTYEGGSSSSVSASQGSRSVGRGQCAGTLVEGPRSGEGSRREEARPIGSHVAAMSSGQAALRRGGKRRSCFFFLLEAALGDGRALRQQVVDVAVVVTICSSRQIRGWNL